MRRKVLSVLTMATFFMVFMTAGAGFGEERKAGQSVIPLAVGKCALENQSLSGKLGSGTFSWYLDILEVIPGKTPEDSPKAKARFII